ncbi:phage tail tape measure protein [Lactobacillus helveticus]|nr:phage tail tape measure protein [Lactobacillus helveticus]PXZ27693.1 phage tail tape measure protein [Lactobacillus helveticus]PXZ31479.1 phage tail tape measure protein [Lactobacillus helveticus]PXZ36254.1 phage tail tape measure protein [Lactobacillus helveticus]PXZ37828.1 phage tail tape measure protein [Lactobacillus helveticus]
MADIEHLGIGINTNIDYDSLTKANETTKKFISNLGVLEKRLNRLKVPTGLSSDLNKIKSLSDTTARSVSDLKNKFNGFATAGESASRRVDEATNKNVNSINKYRDAMNQLSPSMKRAGDTAKEASQSFNTAKGAAEKAGVSMDKTRESSEKTATGFGKLHEASSKLVNVSTMIAASMVPVAAAFKKANDEATQLAAEYNVIKNLQETGGDSAATARRNTAAIQRENRALSIKYGVDQNELAKGSEQLIRRGYSGPQDLAAQKYFVQAAKATNESYNDIVAAAAPMLEQFGYKKKAGTSKKKMADYTRQVLNKAAYVGNVTSGSVGGEGGFGNSFKMAGSILHSTGQSLSSSLAVLGTLSSFGEEGTQAGTGVRQIVSSLLGASKSKTKSAALHDLGLTAGDFFTKNGNMKQLPDVFRILHNATRGKKSNRVQSDVKQIFGQTGFNDASILTKNYQDVANNVKAANRANSTNYITKLSNSNMNSLQNQLEKTKQLFNDVGKSFAKQIAPGLANMLKLVNKVLEAVRGWPQPVKRTLGYVTAITGALSTATVAKKLAGNLLGIGGKSAIQGTAKGATGSASRSLIGSALNFAKTNAIGGKFAKTGLGKKAAGLLGGTAGKGATALAGVGIAATSGVDLYKAITAKNSTAKFKNYGKSIGSAIGGGIGLWLGGPAGAAVGTMLGQVAGGWAGKMAKQFSKTKFGKAIGKDFRQAVWSVKQALRPLGRTVHSSLGTVGKEFNSLNRTVGKAWRDLNRNKDFRAFKRNLSNFFKSSIVATARFGIKQVTTIFKTGIKVAIDVIKGLTKIFKGIVGVVKNTVKLVSDVFHGRWSKVWGDAKGIVKGAVKMMTGWIDTLNKVTQDIFGGIISTAKNVWDFVTGHDSKVSSHHENSTSVGSANKSVANIQNGQGGKHHASKSHATTIADINKSTHLGAHANGTASLVGEAGPELAYKPYSNRARLLGARGPQITHIQAGEKILNARDTRKVMSGGLGTGLILKGYATGNTTLGKTTQKVTDDYKQIKDKSTKSLNELTRKNNSSWRKITSTTTKQAEESRKGAITKYSDMSKGVTKQMTSLHSHVVDLASTTSKGFGKELNHMTKYAHSAMNGTIDEVNSGIKGIDRVLGQFGGNTQVIKPVKFARGSNGRLTQNTVAMVNDATTGPVQEAIVKNSGEILFPRHRNQIVGLEKGDAVLNGSQTQELAQSIGLTHFAKGSGVSHSELRKIAERAGANPAKSFADMYTSNIKSAGADFRKGAIALAKNASTHYGNPWSTAMWNVINDAIGGANGKGGTREAFLKYAESTFTGVKYQLGAASKELSDCSGMVMQALRHFGINIGRTTVAMQESSGVQYLGKSLSKTLPGDLVIFGHGTGAAGHVGIIKNPKTGTMFNETEPRAHVSRIADDKGMGYGYYRVRGLHNATQSKKTAKADKRLIALAKRELGSSAIKWIKDKLGDDFGSLGSFSIVGDLKERAKALAGGLKKLDPRATKNGIAAILGNWNFESGGLNPSAVNSSGGASGLGQWLGGRKTNLMAFARRKGKSWENPAVQLEFAVRGEGSDSAILRHVLEGHGSVASLANMFSAQWERGGYNAQHVKGAMEVRKVLGFAKGGRPKAHTPFIAGEHGPELITADGPVKVDTHEETKSKLRAATIHKPAVSPVKREVGSHPITININVNGNVEGKEASLRRLAQMIGDQVDQKLDVLFEHIANDGGVDESYY